MRPKCDPGNLTLLVSSFEPSDKDNLFAARRQMEVLPSWASAIHTVGTISQACIRRLLNLTKDSITSLVTKSTLHRKWGVFSYATGEPGILRLVSVV